MPEKHFTKKIIFIPPKPPEHKKLKVAAYCRVSTLGPAQLQSLEWQIKSYTKMISDHRDWIFAGVFSDAGKVDCGETVEPDWTSC